MVNFREFRAAISSNKPRSVRALVKDGADINMRDSKGSTPLFWAIKLHCLNHVDIRIVKMLIKAGADVNARDDDGWRPIFTPIRNNSLAAAKVLVKAGADVTVRDNDGYGAMDMAESLEMHQLLARAWPQDHPLRLHELAKADLADEIADAVAAGVDLNGSDWSGRTPLFWAAMAGSLAAAKALVEAGADVTVCDRDGYMAMNTVDELEMRLLLARAWPQDHPHQLHALANADLVDELVDAVAAGADVNARDQKGWTPLTWAVWMDNLAAVQMLIEAGADVDARDKHDFDVVNWARSPEMHQLLAQTHA